MSGLVHFPGFYGIATGVSLFALTWLIVWLLIDEGPFAMDVQGEKGSFLPLFSIYLDIVKFVMGLSSGSIALLVGSATFRLNGAAGPLLSSLASPLFDLAISLLCGAFFMVFMTIDYESYRHGTRHYTRLKYSRNQALGYSCLLCFSAGYLWLIFIVAG
jgi:hypothetical protein